MSDIEGLCGLRTLNINDLVKQQMFFKARSLARESDNEKQQDWPYSYKKISSAEGGPVHPRSNINDATLFFFPLSLQITNMYDSIDTVPQEVLCVLHAPMKLLSASGWKFVIVPHNTEGWENLPCPPSHILYHSYAFTMARSGSGAENRPVIQGCVNLKPSYDISRDIISQLEDHNTSRPIQYRSFTGPVVIMRSTCEIGKASLNALKDQLNPNEIAWLPHESSEIHLEPTKLYLRTETGCGRIPKLPFGQGTFLHRNLSTLFKLYIKDSNELVAQCLLSYYNANFDEQGPTIEMLSVKKKFRGNGYCLVIYNIVERFCLERWTAQGLYQGSLHSRIMVTSQPGSQIEINCRSKGKTSISDRIFFAQYVAFDEHVTENNRKDIPGQDQVKYFSVEARDKLLQSKLAPPCPHIRKQYGRLPCYYCGKLSSYGREYQHCSQCKIAYYCSQECQSADWVNHKVWCNKSRDEIDDIYLQQTHDNVT